MTCAPQPSESLLGVEDLSCAFDSARGSFLAVDHVSFAIEAGRTLALVGESGCGKSVCARSILRLIPSPPGRITSGRVLFRDRDLLALPLREMRSIRGQQISMIFQEPMTALNPVFSVGDQLVETLRTHDDGLSRRDARARAAAMLEIVGIAEPRRRLRSFPHELSGGMRQRVLIAIAIACEPSLLIADEPTTALDVTIQAQILTLLGDLQRRLGMGLLLITHDLGVVFETCDDVAVMYAGHIVERAPTTSIFALPRHPYTHGLLRSMPGYTEQRDPGRPLYEIPGMVPDPTSWPQGCRFRPRCAHAQSRCHTEPPLLRRIGDAEVRCHFPLEHAP